MTTRCYRAAGGIVLDDHGRVLLIRRWVTRGSGPVLEIRLPKGHVEPGESDVVAALREVCEETGYCGLAIETDLGEALTQFTLRDEEVRRNEHYFLMRLTDATPGTPKFDSPTSEEAHFQPVWAADITAAGDLLTFQPEREFARRAAHWLQQRPAPPLPCDGDA